MADDDNPFGQRPASTTVETPPGVPRITVTPEDDNPFGASTKTRAGDRTRQLIAEQSKMSWPAWLNQGAGDFTASTADAASFGMRPRLDAATGVASGTYPDYASGLARELQEKAMRSERSPLATLGGNVAGGIAGGIAGGATKLGTNIAAHTMPYLPASVAKALGFGTEAGVVGATQGAGQTYSGEIDDYLKAAKSGGITGAVAGATLGPLTPTSAVQMRSPVKPPSNDQLRAISDKGYEVLSKIPVTYPGKHLQGELSAAESQMMTQGVAPDQAQTVFRIIERIRNHPGSVSPAQIDAWRQSLNNMKNMPTVGSEKAGVAAAILRDSFDDMIQNGVQAASNPALAARAAEVVGHARGNRAAMFRSQQLTDPAENAAARAATGGPPTGEQLVPKGLKLGERKGGAYPNQRGWNAEERDQLAAAIVPTFPEKAAKFGADYFGRDIPALAGGKLIADQLRGYSARGVESRWDAAAEALRRRSPAFERANQGVAPVPGPGQGMLPQAIQGGAAAPVTMPLGRDALVPSMMQQFGFY